MSAKLSVLRACHRVLKPGGRIGLYTILICEGLSAEEYRRTRQALAPGLAHQRSYGDLLAAAGFVDIRETDVTADFRRSGKAWVDGRLRFEKELRAAEGEEAWRDSMAFRRGVVRELARGTIGRSLFVARKP